MRDLGERRLGVAAGGIGPLVLMIAAVWSGPCAAAGWADSRIVGPLLCQSDFALAGVETALGELARLPGDLVSALGISAPQQWIEVYLFHDKATYDRYVKRYLPDVPYRRALYVKSQGPGKVFAYWSRDFDVDLRHECTHALLHASLPMVPLWLDEGLAQYFEVVASKRAAGHPHMVRTRWGVRWGGITPMETLEKKANLAEMGRSEYQASWAWVHFMLHGPAEAREGLRAYLADIQAEVPPGVLSARLQQRLPNAQQRIAEHFRSATRVAERGADPIRY